MLHEKTTLLAENFWFPLITQLLKKIRLFSFERSKLENNCVLFDIWYNNILIRYPGLSNVILS